jgi:ribosomal protein S6
MAICCQNLMLGAHSNRNTLRMLAGALLKNSVTFEQASYYVFEFTGSHDNTAHILVSAHIAVMSIIRHLVIREVI